MSVWTLLRKLRPGLHSMCILEFHGKCGGYNLKHVSVILNRKILFHLDVCTKMTY